METETTEAPVVEIDADAPTVEIEPVTELEPSSTGAIVVVLAACAAVPAVWYGSKKLAKSVKGRIKKVRDRAKSEDEVVEVTATETPEEK